MNNIEKTLHELALYEYYSALAANLPPVGIAAVQKNGKIVSAGPVLYTNGHIETAFESLCAKLEIDYYKATRKEDDSLPLALFDPTKAISLLVSIRLNPKGSDDYSSVLIRNSNINLYSPDL